jgi:threonine aldolase
MAATGGYPDPSLRARCTRFLGGHGRATALGWAQRLMDSPDLALELDVYSDGPAMTRLEQETAALLGKPAGMFFHKGITAQQAALLAHCDAAGRRVVALHPMSHFAMDEHDTLDRLAGLVSLRLGSDIRHFTAADLERAAERLGCVTLEVPLRRMAFTAPAWDDLAGISAWCRARGVRFHLDGARLWEVAPHYGRSLAEIGALADSVYVSFYKGLGGMGGCVLAGEAALLAACRPWRNRFGGDLPTIFPYVLTGLEGLRTHLPRMAEYHRHACAIAAAVDATPGLRARPAVPHGNSFQVHIAAERAAVEAAASRIAAEEGIWLVNRVVETAWPEWSMVEIVVGAATMEWSAGEAAAALGRLTEKKAVLFLKKRTKKLSSVLTRRRHPQS